MKSITNLNHIVALVLLALLASCSGKTEDKTTLLANLKKQQSELQKKIETLEKEISKENPSAVKTKMKEVNVAELAPRAFDHYVQTQGIILSNDNIQMSSKSVGVVTQVYSREGDAVSRGQILAQIDNSLIVRGIDELKAQLGLATTVYERQKNLWDQKIGTEIQYLQAKNSKESLERRLATLNEQNEQTKIKAPITGTVDAVNIKVGENVSPGMPVFRVVNTDDLKASAKVSESYISNIHKGNKAIVQLTDIHKEITAPVSFVGRNIDALTRSFPVEIKLHSSPDLRPNMTSTLKIIFHTEKNALCVPVNLVQDIKGEKVVYVAEQNGDQLVARKRVVEVVGVYDNLAQIKTGLKAGDKIITVGYQALNDGELIKI
ncbi:MAG: RND efflux system, membrane fusion protein [Cytophagales bacterium]|jgi:RND family efflux transporter MFP subunit|nr:efflux RND transporter periplasmic adaptor subunit [Bacteroidota bacterium]MBS1981502.1 efflux RND transporter periplasmic adaptor subunit [Bacteroidota bacterium]WHZ08563.1 MAG: RND efflux system, membrane fusion protein [Cytophagales bacterium]